MRSILLAVAIILTARASAAQEVAVPDVPENITVKAYAVRAFSQERYPEWRFVITFTDDRGNVKTDEHYGPSTVKDPVTGAPIKNPTGAEDMLKWMNTANFSTNSMNKRLLQHLVDHGKIPPSTVQGTPDTPPASDPFEVAPKPKPATTKPPIKK